MRGRAWDLRPETVGRYFSVGGVSASTAGSIDHALAILWNPSSTRSIWVVETQMCRDTAGSGGVPQFVRTSTKGTPGTTVTPTADNDFWREAAPESGAVLDLALYSVVPTIQGPAEFRFNDTTVVGYTFQVVLPGIGARVPPGTGWGIATASGTAMSAKQVYFTFRE